MLVATKIIIIFTTVRVMVIMAVAIGQAYLLVLIIITGREVITGLETIQMLAATGPETIQMLAVTALETIQMVAATAPETIQIIAVTGLGTIQMVAAAGLQTIQIIVAAGLVVVITIIPTGITRPQPGHQPTIQTMFFPIKVVMFSDRIIGEI
jgi:hypothetical protein